MAPTTNPSEFADVLERLIAQLRAGRSRLVSPSERTHIRSVVGAWYENYSLAFHQMLGDEQLLAPVDDNMQRLLQLASRDSSRRTVNTLARATRQYFSNRLLVPLSRAYWSRAPQRSPAGRDEEVARGLRRMDADLADSYEQAAVDLEDNSRLSYRGPAAELREVLTGVLHRLAPTEKVEATEWYKEARRSGTRTEPKPTRAERVKFILRSRVPGSAATEAGETFLNSVEERLGSVVTATYKRGSAATHVGTEQGEVQSLLRYINTLLRELLPPNGSTSGAA